MHDNSRSTNVALKCTTHELESAVELDGEQPSIVKYGNCSLKTLQPSDKAKVAMLLLQARGTHRPPYV